MLTITTNALAVIHDTYASGTTLRLDISPRGCGAPQVSLVPDSFLSTDTVIEMQGIMICVDSTLSEKVKVIELDACNGRFVVTLACPIVVSGCGTCPASPLQGGLCGILEGRNF